MEKYMKTDLIDKAIIKAINARQAKKARILQFTELPSPP
jgi:hypothetical protein